MKNVVKSFGILSLALILTAGAFAQPRQAMRPGKGFAQGGHFPLLMMLRAQQDELNITDEQWTRIKDIVAAHQKLMIDMRSAAEKHRIEMRELFDPRESRDLKKLRKELDKASSFRNDMLIEHLKLRQDVMNVLTQEQRDAIEKNFTERFGQGRPFMRGRGGPGGMSMWGGGNRGFGRRGGFFHGHGMNPWFPRWNNRRFW